MNKLLAVLALIGFAAVPATAGDPLAINREGGATISVKLQQKPPAGQLASRYLGTDPGKCLAAIPFEATLATGVSQQIRYWFVHSDGTKSPEYWMGAPGTSGKVFTYEWYKYLPPNKPFAGWVRAEATWKDHAYTYKSADVPFTVTCVPAKPATWPTAPIIVTPVENQKVAGGSLVVQPMNPGASKCADGGVFFLKLERRETPAAPWAPTGLMKPLACVPAGAKKPLDGFQPGLYRVQAQESNGKHGFSSAWSGWRQFEVLK